MTVFKPGLTSEIATLIACCTFICGQILKDLLHTYRTLQRETVFVTFSIICTQACTMIQNSGKVTIRNFTVQEINKWLIGISKDTPFHLSSETVPNPVILLHFRTGKVILILQFHCTEVLISP